MIASVSYFLHLPLSTKDPPPHHSTAITTAAAALLPVCFSPVDLNAAKCVEQEGWLLNQIGKIEISVKQMIFDEFWRAPKQYGTLTGCLFHGVDSVIPPVLALISAKTIMWILDLHLLSIFNRSLRSFIHYTSHSSPSSTFPPLSTTSTSPASPSLSYRHQQSEAVFRAVRSRRILRNGAGKLPYMAIAPVALATSCPWEKGVFGVLGGSRTDSPSQNS